MSKIYDVLVIGGGPAGLSIAGALARQLYTALVLDSGVYRNARAEHMHMVPGFDHVNPADFRAKVRQDVQRRYETIEFKTSTVATVRKTGGLFEAVDESGEIYWGRKLALGSGVRDMVEEEVEGYADCWGRSIFHCLFCHGFEERGADSVGVLAAGVVSTPEMIGHIAMMAKRLSKHVTVYTNGNAELAASAKAAIKSSKITYEDGKIAKFENRAGVDDQPATVVVHLADGTTKEEGFVASHPRVEQRSRFASQLGLEMTPAGDIKVSLPFHETSLEGCFAAGDAATPMRAVVQAEYMGIYAANGMISQLQKELDAKDEL